MGLDSATIGERLAAARKATGLTQQKVAGYLGIKREVIAYYETGARPVTTAILSRMADLYGYRISYFLDEHTSQQEKPHVAMAFRAADLTENDLHIIAEVKRIASNLDSLNVLLEKHERS